MSTTPHTLQDVWRYFKIGDFIRVKRSVKGGAVVEGLLSSITANGWVVLEENTKEEGIRSVEFNMAPYFRRLLRPLVISVSVITYILPITTYLQNFSRTNSTYPCSSSTY